MEAIENRKVLGPSAEALNESDAERKSTEEKADHDLQLADSELEKGVAALQLEQRQEHVLEARLTTDAASTANTGSEWDPWKLMILRKA